MKENQRVEWKESWRDDCLKVISGFANAEGGTLVIGKNDVGDVVGAKDARKLLEDLPNKVRDILGILVDVNLKKRAGREYLEIVIPAYTNPISYRGEFYYRTGSTNQALKGASLERFLLRRQGRTWDGVPSPGYRVSDLSRQALKTFRNRAAKSGRIPAELLTEPDKVLLDKLRLFDRGYLKRAAVLLFHEEPDGLATGAYVKLGYFRSDSDLEYHDEISGDLFTQVDRTMETLLRKYLRADIRYEGVQRIETYPVPEPALREAVINAIAHKDYGSGIPIQISVYANKLMVWNPGQLPPDWTLRDFTSKHASVPHNPDIANAFFRAALLESWGRGIELIRAACRNQGAPEPAFRWDGGLWVEFAFLGRTTLETTPITTLETPKKPGGTSEVTGQVAGQVTGQVTGEVARLLEACVAPMSARELRERLDLKGHANFRRLYLVPALNAGLLRMSIPDKPNSRLQKYLLSSEGSAVLVSMAPQGAGQGTGEVTGEVASEVARSWGTETRKKTGKETREKTGKKTREKTLGDRKVRK